MKLISSWDDGCVSDLKVAEILKKHDIPGTFYWPVEWHSLAYSNFYEPLSYADAIEISKEFEIGSHTITHRHLTKLAYGDAVYEIQASKAALSQLLVTPIEKFCPPRGYITDELTLVAMEEYSSIRLTKGGNLVHVHPDSGANSNRRWQDIALEKGNKFREVHLWGHSWELDKYNMWDELDEFLSLHS